MRTWTTGGCIVAVAVVGVALAGCGDGPDGGGGDVADASGGETAAPAGAGGGAVSPTEMTVELLDAFAGTPGAGLAVVVSDAAGVVLHQTETDAMGRAKVMVTPGQLVTALWTSESSVYGEPTRVRRASALLAPDPAPESVRLPYFVPGSIDALPTAPGLVDFAPHAGAASYAVLQPLRAPAAGAGSPISFDAAWYEEDGFAALLLALDATGNMVDYDFVEGQPAPPVDGVTLDLAFGGHPILHTPVRVTGAPAGADLWFAAESRSGRFRARNTLHRSGPSAELDLASAIAFGSRHCVGAGATVESTDSRYVGVSRWRCVGDLTAELALDVDRLSRFAPADPSAVDRVDVVETHPGEPGDLLEVQRRWVGADGAHGFFTVYALPAPAPIVFPILPAELADYEPTATAPMTAIAHLDLDASTSIADALPSLFDEDRYERAVTEVY